MHALVLALANFVISFEIETNANIVETGGILIQQGHPVVCYSKSFTLTKWIYHVHDNEFLHCLIMC